MTFDELWPHLAIPGEFDAFDQCDQQRWRMVLEQAYNAGFSRGADDAAMAERLACAAECDRQIRLQIRICGSDDAIAQAKRCKLMILRRGQPVETTQD